MDKDVNFSCNKIIASETGLKHRAAIGKAVDTTVGAVSKAGDVVLDKTAKAGKATGKFFGRNAQVAGKYLGSLLFGPKDKMSQKLGPGTGPSTEHIDTTFIAK